MATIDLDKRSLIQRLIDEQKGNRQKPPEPVVRSCLDYDRCKGKWLAVAGIEMCTVCGITE